LALRRAEARRGLAWREEKVTGVRGSGHFRRTVSRSDPPRSLAMNDLSKVEVVFFAALEKDSPGERAAYLDEACAGDSELRRGGERLLSAHGEVGSFLQATPQAAPADEPPGTEGPGTKIGPYKLLQRIGEGGMGVVYLAEQEEPIRRLVAVKVIKPGLD